MEKYGKDLEFLGQIGRKGKEIETVNNIEYLKTELFTLYHLSLTEETFIATDRFNYYTVKLK